MEYGQLTIYIEQLTIGNGKVLKNITNATIEMSNMSNIQTDRKYKKD